MAKATCFPVFVEFVSLAQGYVVFNQMNLHVFWFTLYIVSLAQVYVVLNLHVFCLLSVYLIHCFIILFFFLFFTPYSHVV